MKGINCARRNTAEKSLISLVCLMLSSQGRTPSEALGPPEALHGLNQKLCSPAFQLILPLLIRAGLKLLSLNVRPRDRAYHSGSGAQGMLTSMTGVRLSPSRQPKQMAHNLSLSLPLMPLCRKRG